MPETLKIYGVNATAFAVVSLADISLVLQILLLATTLCWTIFKIIAEWRKLKNKTDEK
jgi:hypothetical protein